MNEPYSDGPIPVQDLRPTVDRLPGQPADLGRITALYRESADRMIQMLPGYIDRAFASFVERPLEGQALQKVRNTIRLFRFLPEQDRAKRIDTCLDGFDYMLSTAAGRHNIQLISTINSIKEAAAEQIGILPPDLRVKYIDKVINEYKEYQDPYKAAIRQLHTLPERTRRERRRKKNYINRFTHGINASFIRAATLTQLGSVQERYRERPFYKCIYDGNSDVSKSAAYQFYLLPDRKKVKIARRVLSRNDKSSQIVASQLWTIEQDKKGREELIISCLRNPNTRLAGIAHLKYLSDPKERAQYVREFSYPKENPKDNYPEEVRIAALGQLYTLLEEDKEEIFSRGIDDENIFIRRATLRQLDALSEVRRKDYIDSFIDGEHLGSDSNAIIVSKIRTFTSEDTKKELIKKCLGKDHLKNLAMQELGIFSEEEKQEIIGQFPEVRELVDKLTILAQTNELYTEITSGSGLFQGDMRRYQSGHTPIRVFDADGGNFAWRNNLILIKTMSQNDYFALQKASEDQPDLWASLGFDYCPISQILGIEQRDDGKVDVYSRFIRGPSVIVWEEGDLYSPGNAKTGFDLFEMGGGIVYKGKTLYEQEIDDMKKKILIGLKRLGITIAEREIADRNFMLEFDTYPDGKPKLSLPRVHLIDLGGSSFTN